MGFCAKGLKNEFETAVVNEPSVLEPLKFHCNASKRIRWNDKEHRSKSDLGQSGPKVIKLFSCSTQLSMQFFLFINVKMPTVVGILTFMNRKTVGILTFMNRKNNIIGSSKPEKY